MQQPILMPIAQRVLHIGLALIALSLLRLWVEIQNAAPFPAGKAAYFGGLLEYPAAALMLLTGAVVLFDRAARETK